MNPAAGPPSPVFTLSPVRPFLTSLTRAGPSGPSKPLIPHPKTMWEVWRWPSARAVGPEMGGWGARDTKPCGWKLQMTPEKRPVTT